MKMPTLKPYTLPSHAKNQPHVQNLSKSMSLPSGLKKKYDRTTMCINHWAEITGFKCITFNQLCGGLTVKCFEMPNASYTNRCA